MPLPSRLGSFLASLLFLAWLTPAQAEVSRVFKIEGQIPVSLTYDLARLEALPSVTRQVSYRTSKGTVTAIFKGVPLMALLEAAGLKSSSGDRKTALARAVTVSGTDGYSATFSLGELLPDFGNAGVIVAYNMDGHDLGRTGFARLVVPGDKMGGRYVDNIAVIAVSSPGALSRQDGSPDTPPDIP